MSLNLPFEISLKLSSLTSSHLSETLKLTLTISPETHHLSSSHTNAVPAEARPTAVPAADRLRPTSRPKPQVAAGFHRRSSIQALGFYFILLFFFCCGLLVVVVVAVVKEKDWRFRFFFPPLLWTGGGGGGVDGGGGCGWCCGSFRYWDILFYYSGL